MHVVTGSPSFPGIAGAQLVHSAGDVVRAAECEHALLRRADELLGRAPRRERPADVMLERTAALGAAHRRRALDAYRDRFGPAPADGAPGGVVVVDEPRATTADELLAAHAGTLAALERGADVVAGAVLLDGRFSGRADFLVRAGRPGDSGTAPYAVWEATLARRAKVPALLRLAAHAEQLTAVGVDPTGQGHLLLGAHGEGPASSHHPLAEVLPVYRARRDRMLEVLAEHLADDGPVAWGDPRFVACGRLGVCADCAASAEEHRDVLLVGGVYAGQRDRLAAAGVTTIDALAAAEEPPAGIPEGAFARWRDQAALQLGTAPGDGRVRYRTDGPDGPRDAELRWSMPDPSAVDRLPAPSPGDVFFDFEGDPWWSDPEGREPRSGHGLDYLFGWVTRPGVADPGDVLLTPLGDEHPDDRTPPFHGLWADTPEAERDALVAFVDWLAARRRRWPDLHVYHYADYERAHLLSIAARHGTYEDEVDDLLRDGVLVDLWKVVRPALRISHRSRSIKRLEPLYMGAEPGREGVTDGAASIVEYAEYAALRASGDHAGADARQAQILAYNRYDCVSTLRLLDWLREARAQVGEPPAPPAEAAAPRQDEPAEPTRRRLDTDRRLALEDDVRAAAESAAPGAEPAAARALALLGGAVGYYRREAKPSWHEHFARLESPPDQWPGRRSSMVVEKAEVRRDWEVEPGRSAPARVLALAGRAVEGSELVDGAPVWLLYDDPVPPGVEPPTGRAVRGAHARAGIVGTTRDDATQELVVREQLRRGAEPYDALPVGVAVDALVPTGPQEQAVEDAAAAALAAWRADGELPGGPANDLLRRRPPRLLPEPASSTLPAPVPGPDGEPDLTHAVRAAVRRLDRSYLAVQGPPGTGKTSLAARVVADLVAAGWRVGVVAQSHAVVENLLHAALRAGVGADRVAKKARSTPRAGAATPAAAEWPEVSAEALAEVATRAARSGDGCLVGGTAWDFAHTRWPEAGLDLLVVDEAGQFSLANTVAVARAASRLLLLGDPQQLGQVSRGAHPDPAVAGSALGWLTGEEDVLPGRFGYFLPASYRMHPALCREVSELAYDGRLHAHPRAAARRLDGVAPGVRQVLVEPDPGGSAVASAVEAAEVVRQVRAVLGRPWHPGEGPARPLAQDDVLVVAAYNAQVHRVRQELDAAGLPEVPVGTVDMFQGREAVVVILTLAAASPERAPRGTGFLLSRNRVNVAVSRARWSAVVVRSPHLTEHLPQSARRLQELGAFLALGEASG